MNTLAAAETTTLIRLPLRRVQPIDAFRGVTILLMVFVNTLNGVRGMPAWLYHTPPEVDGMTLPDGVFPAFLIIVGMSIPYALVQRLAIGETPAQLTRHVLTRTLSLLVLGVFMVNTEGGYDERAMPISIGLWSLLFYGCALLIWSVYPFQNRRLATSLRLGGLAGLVMLVLLFHGSNGSRWMTPQWWGILGLIGWAYLFTSALFLLARGRMLPLTTALVACVIYYCIANLHAVQSSPVLKMLAQTDNAIDTAIALCGVLTSLIFFKTPGEGLPQRICVALLFAFALVVTGFVLQPHYKISKIDATPTWALYSAAVCVFVFAFLYWLIDVKGLAAWSKLLRPAAAAPLLTYMLPNIVWALMQSLQLKLPAALTQGLMGFLWAVAYAGIVLALAAGLSHLHVKLQL
jgi:heparan-alpha-glucosaminide N-acetyltransferase